MKTHQNELGIDAFNLAGESGLDVDRVIREQREQLAREIAARDYQEKMQRTLAECPGFIGADLPKSEASQGRVVVEPGRVVDALAWLKRRFKVSENLEVSPDNGLAIDLIPRQRNNGSGKRRSFYRPEQFVLTL